jgi:hypothetical protein
VVVLRSDKRACEARQRARAKRAVNPGRNPGLEEEETETVGMRVRRKGQSNILNANRQFYS